MLKTDSEKQDFIRTPVCVGTSRSEYIIILFLITIVIITSAGVGYIFAEGETKSTGARESTLMDLIKAGGMVGYFIILCSIVGMGFAIEHIVNIKRDKLCPPEVVAELEALVEEGRYEEAITLCNANPTFFCNIVGAALSKVNEGYESMVEAMQTSGEQEAARLNQKISYISLIGNMAPMLGLTGTVTGMIAAFSIIKTKMSPSPADLAKGVEEALVTTAEGLFVAIPLMTIYFYYKNKVTLHIIDLGIMAGEFVDKFKGVTVEQQEQ
ncbi:MAG: MotA/TolQ/ExbB proton channel family protein [Planctomycetota bacterium]|nr:MotA/TolQ/ExbB proton channel family protein [Planctomycetota bacterium]